MIRIGTRGSELALWQANYIAGLIGKDKTEIIVIKTAGDKIQNLSFDKMEGKAFFTKEIEDALLANEIDIAVHSLKDLPTEETKGLTIAAIPVREDPSDILLIRNQCYNEENVLHLSDGAAIGTSSVRRSAQIKNAMPSLVVLPLRGNVTTRIQKLRESKFDAIILATAGINRLKIDLNDLKTLTLPFSFFLPSPSQGALAVQIRDNETALKDLLRKINDEDTEKAVNAERSFLKHFGGGCHIPIGGFAYIIKGTIHLSGSISSSDGKKSIRESITGNNPESVGEVLAMLLKEKGADQLL